MNLKPISCNLLAMLLTCSGMANAETSAYAVQMGQFTSKVTAESLAQASMTRGYPAKVIGVQDASKKMWWVVAVGQFASPDQARAEGALLSNTFGLPSSAPVILLPPKGSDKTDGVNPHTHPTLDAPSPAANILGSSPTPLPHSHTSDANNQSPPPAAPCSLSL